MLQLVRHLSRFFSQMDARAATSVLVSAVLIVFVVGMLVYGQAWLNLQTDGQHERLIEAAAGSPAAILIVIAIFAVLALTGFPQFLMIAATVAAFGPVYGALYSWVATMASATLTFGIGYYLGGGWVTRYGGTRTHRLIDFLARRGILASALIRVVPSAPFIVVNGAAGAARIPLWKYWLGSGLGIVPKIVFVAAIAAFAPDEAGLSEASGGGAGLLSAIGPLRLSLIVAAIVVWIGFMLGMRALYKRMQARAAPLEETEAS